MSGEGKSCCASCAKGGPCEGCSCGDSCDCSIKKGFKDKLPGGVADKKKPEDFEADLLADGVAHEMEHTKDQGVATEIAMDHLSEDLQYYMKLDRIEKAESVNWKVRKNFKVVRKIDFQGLDISIEHDKGMIRHWKDRGGEEGETKMYYPYGYICRTDGADGEQVDVYVGPNSKSDKVFVIHQLVKPDFVKYDEDKVMVGFDSVREAKSAYLMHFDSPKFFGSMTTTDIDAFKRMFVKKSNEATYIGTDARFVSPADLEQFKEEWSTVHKSLAFSDGDVDFEKGILDRLKDIWNKVKQKFGTSTEEESKPTKTWIRNTSQKCKTGVCVRLDGTTIPIDDTFTAMRGMQVDGPPAHLHCECTLDFNMSKSMNEEIQPELQQPAVTPVPPMGMPMMPVPIPNDVETYEGVLALLNRLGSVKDPELMEIASKIWGDGYNFEGQAPEKARAEILGFLLDQRDLLGIEPEMNEIPDLQPSPSLPVMEPQGSSDYSGISQTYASENNAPAPEENFSGEESQEPSLTDWFSQDYWSNKKNQEQEPTG